MNIINIMNSVSIIASMHIRASIRCLCCVDRLIIIIKKIIDRVILVSSIYRGL